MTSKCLDLAALVCSIPVAIYYRSLSLSFCLCLSRSLSLINIVGLCCKGILVVFLAIELSCLYKTSIVLYLQESTPGLPAFVLKGMLAKARGTVQLISNVTIGDEIASLIQ